MSSLNNAKREPQIFVVDQAISGYSERIYQLPEGTSTLLIDANQDGLAK